VTLQAQDAKTAFTALIGQIESSMSSVGSVAAATNSNPAAMERLAASDPSVGVFSAVATLRRSSDGDIVVTSRRGSASEPLPALGGSKGRALTEVMTHGGFGVLGFFGSGAKRRLAVAEGAPLVPGGYVVYAELPLPEGTTVHSTFPNLQYALYTGPDTSAPVLIATSKTLPLTGDVISQLVDLNDLNATTAPKARWVRTAVRGQHLWLGSRNALRSAAMDPRRRRTPCRASGCLCLGSHFAAQGPGACSR
jgi:hypothetical protein